MSLGVALLGVALLGMPAAEALDLAVRVGFPEGVAPRACAGVLRLGGQKHLLALEAEREDLLVARLQTDAARHAWISLTCGEEVRPLSGVLLLRDTRVFVADHAVFSDNEGSLTLRPVAPGLGAGTFMEAETLYKLGAGVWGFALLLMATRLRRRLRPLKDPPDLADEGARQTSTTAPRPLPG